MLTFIFMKKKTFLTSMKILTIIENDTWFYTVSYQGLSPVLLADIIRVGL